MGLSDVTSRLDIVRWIAFTAVVGLTGFLCWRLPQPGYTVSRLLLIGLVLACAWTGALGVLLSRPRVALIGAIGIWLLGFWQAVLWVGMLPTAVALALAALVMRDEDSDGDRIDGTAQP